MQCVHFCLHQLSSRVPWGKYRAVKDGLLLDGATQYLREFAEAKLEFVGVRELFL
jgi:hypothetical protein